MHHQISNFAKAAVPKSGQAQVLDFTVKSESCLTAGSTITMTVHYRSSIQKPTSALSFYAYWDSTDAYGGNEATVRLTSISPPPNVKCDLGGRYSVVHNASKSHRASYSCASMTAENVIPATVPNAMTLTFTATGATGTAKFGVKANVLLGDSKYNYAVAPSRTLMTGNSCRRQYMQHEAAHTVTHPVLASRDERIEVLTLRAETRKCLMPGDVSTIKVLYRITQPATSTAAAGPAFDLQFDSSLFEVQNYRGLPTANISEATPGTIRASYVDIHSSAVDAALTGGETVVLLTVALKAKNAAPIARTTLSVKFSAAAEQGGKTMTSSPIQLKFGNCALHDTLTRPSVLPAVVDEAAAMAKYPDGVQFLALSARSPKCVLRGDATAVSVDYKSSDGSRRSALSFKVVYDPDYYALDSRQESGDWISDCPLKAFVAHHTADGAYVDFTCASLAGEAVVAAAQTNIVALKLIATGKVGETHIAVSGRDSLRGGKFTYSSSAPLAIRSGDCYHPSSWELVTTQHSLKADDLNETVQALNLAVSARACNAFGDQVEARVSYAAGKQSRLIAFSLQYDARELQLLSYRSAHSGLACHKFDLEATTYRYAKQERVLGHVRILCATDGDYIPRELNDVVVAKFSSAARTSVKSLLSIVANKEAVLRTMTMSTLVAPPITVEQQYVCPRPKQPHYTVFKRSVTVAHSPEERFQMLSLQVHSKACVTIGDVSQAAVNYTASDGKWSRSLGVTLKWSKKVFTLLQMKAGKLNGCDLKVFGKTSYTEKNGHLMWACASLSGEKVVPPRFNFLLLAEFQAMGVTTGQAHFSVHGVDKYGDHSYMYQRATRVEIKAGNCPQAASLPIATGERFGTITHMAKMGNMVQGLSLEAVTRKCVLKNNYVHVDVNYMAVGENGAQAKTPAVSFRLVFEPRFFRVASATSANIPGCELKGFVKAQHYVAYTCASLQDDSIVPSRVNRIARVVLLSTGSPGTARIRVQPNNALGGSGFAYSAASDILLTSGPCTFAPTPAPQQATGTPSPTPPPTKDVIQMLAEAPNATGAYQLLDLSVEADSCMQAGDRAKAWVNYHTSDDDAASALAFKLAYDSEFFAFESKVISPKFNQHKCALFGFKDVHGSSGEYVTFACAQMDGGSASSAAIDKSIPGLVTVTLKATGKTGSTPIAVIPNEHLAGRNTASGVVYRYLAAGAVNLKMGRCTPEASLTPLRSRIVVHHGVHHVQQGEAVQLLTLQSSSRKCMRAGDIADIQVSYYAADQKRTSALSFMLLYNKLHYRLKSKKMPEIPGCDLAQFHDVKDTSEQMDHSHGIAFSCSSFADVKVLPAKVPRIMEVQLEATGAPGAGQIALVPNKMLHALGYKYKMAAPIELAMGHCSKADMPASFKSRASGRTQVLGVRGNSHRCVEKGDTATFAVDYHTANDERADAVALRLVWHPDYWSLVAASRTTIQGCDLSAYHVNNGILRYSCVSMQGRDILAAALPGLVKVTLRATGQYGTTTVSVEPSTTVHADGYSYVASDDLTIRSGGGCTYAPTPAPTPPTSSPTAHPTKSPTPVPTMSPTASPTKSPTPFPTMSPTASPTQSPTESPTQPPTQSPTQSPTRSPTLSPTQSPTLSPTLSPTPAPKARWIGQHVLGKGTEQVLSLSATTKSCMDVGDRTDLSVSYYAADGAKTTGLSFKLLYDNSYFTLNASATAVGDTSKCHGASGSDSVFNLAMHASAVDYTCTSSHEQNIIPAAASGFLNISLVATGKTGTTNLSIAANPYVKGAGYNYVTGAPLVLHMGPSCTHAPTPQPTKAPSPAPTPPPTKVAVDWDLVPMPVAAPVTDGTNQQVLTMRAFGSSCMTPGEQFNVSVDYKGVRYVKGQKMYAATFALSFALSFDAAAFKVVSHKVAVNEDCELDGFVTAANYIAYTCASMDSRDVVPAKVDGLLEVTFFTRGTTTGSSQIKLTPNDKLHALGYTYAASSPLDVRVGHCTDVTPSPTPAPTPAPPKPVLPLFSFDMGTGSRIGRSDTDGEQYVTFNGEWSAVRDSARFAERSKLCTVTQAMINADCGKQVCRRPEQCTEFTCPRPTVAGCHFVLDTAHSSGRRLAAGANVSQTCVFHQCDEQYCLSPADGKSWPAVDLHLLKDVRVHALCRLGASFQADVTSPSFSTAAAAEKAPPSELAPLPEYLASAKSATSEEVTTMLAHGLMEGAASSVMTSFLASFGGGVNNHFGMGEDQDFGMASPTHLSWAPDEAEIGKKPSAMVLGVLDTSGVAYLTEQGDLYKDLMSTQPKWVPTPPRQCMVTQSDVTAQCGVEECAPPTRCSTIVCPTLPSAPPSLNDGLHFGRCTWVKPPADACDCPKGKCEHARLDDNSCYDKVATASGSACPAGTRECTADHPTVYGAVSDLGLLGLTPYGETTSEGRRFLSHGGYLALRTGVQEQHAVCTVTARDIVEQCGVQTCDAFKTHRFGDIASFTPGNVACGAISMQSCARQHKQVGAVSCPTSSCESTCEVSDWSSWSDCTKTCDSGERTRTRTVVRELPHAVCPPLSEKEGCGTQMCLDDCVAQPWSGWGKCSKSCGGGTQTRTREHFWPDPSNKGRGCGASSMDQNCNTKDCPPTWHQSHIKDASGTPYNSTADYQVCSHTSCKVKNGRTQILDWSRAEAHGVHHHCVSNVRLRKCVCVCSDTFAHSKVVHLVRRKDESQARIMSASLSGHHAGDGTTTRVGESAFNDNYPPKGYKHKDSVTGAETGYIDPGFVATPPEM
jgi:hypothetical protein